MIRNHKCDVPTTQCRYCSLSLSAWCSLLSLGQLRGSSLRNSPALFWMPSTNPNIYLLWFVYVSVHALCMNHRICLDTFCMHPTSIHILIRPLRTDRLNMYRAHYHFIATCGTSLLSIYIIHKYYIFDSVHTFYSTHLHTHCRYLWPSVGLLMSTQAPFVFPSMCF